MRKEEFIAIADKIAEGTATIEEIEQYIHCLNWLDENSSLWDDLPSLEKRQIREAVRVELSRKLHPVHTSVEVEGQSEERSSVSFITYLRQMVAAAILLFLAFAGFYMYQSYRAVNNHEGPRTIQEIVPGHYGATLTLADGSNVPINNAIRGNIAEQSGVKISRTHSGQIRYEVMSNESGPIGYNTIRTSRGQEIQVMLPDNTHVYLNAESSLHYPTRFTNQEQREVHLTGEGYFEVAKDKRRLFIVKSRGQKVEVLGTHFNVSSYDNEPIVRTTLVEGAVKVNGKLLVPGQQARLVNGELTIRNTDVEQVVSWKNGYFIFENEPLERVVDKISRWYDVSVYYADEEVKRLPFGGTISKYEDVRKVLDMIKKAGPVNIDYKSGKLIISSRKEK